MGSKTGFLLSLPLPKLILGSKGGLKKGGKYGLYLLIRNSYALLTPLSNTSYFWRSQWEVHSSCYRAWICKYRESHIITNIRPRIIKVPMKWNFSPLFYSWKLKSMLHWFIIFEFNLCCGAQNNFSLPPKLAKNAVFVFRGLKLVTS